MKKTILSLVTIVHIATGFSQKTPVTLSEKCNSQKKTGWIFFGTGVAVATTGFLITEIDGSGDGSILSENFDVGAWTFFAGLAGCVGSIPFFLSAHNSCKKGNKISFHIKNIEAQLPLVKSSRQVPSFSLRMKLP